MVAINPNAPALTPTVTQAGQPVEITLLELRRGACGRVARVLGESVEAARLKALGVCEGRTIEVLRTGDAWVLRVLGSRIGISRELAASVLLTAA
jgi:Fe2+ transport system protein FeoA